MTSVQTQLGSVAYVTTGVHVDKVLNHLLNYEGSAKLAPPLTAMERAGSAPHLSGWSQQPGPTNSATTRAHIQAFEVALPTIYPI